MNAIAVPAPVQAQAVPQTNSGVGQRLLRAFLLLDRLALAWLLLFSAYFHLQNNYLFLSDVLAYGIVPMPVGIVIAAVLPYLQLVVGLALLFFPKLLTSAFSISASMFAVFLAAQLIAYFRELKISCGCFGASTTSIGWQSISLAAGALVLSALGLGALLLTNRTKKPT